MNLRKTFLKQRKMIFLKNVIIFDVKQTRRHNMMCQMICQKLDMVMGVSIKGTLILCCCWALTYLHPIQNLIRQLATRNSRFSFCNIQSFNATQTMLKLVTLWNVTPFLFETQAWISFTDFKVVIFTNNTGRYSGISFGLLIVVCCQKLM